MYKEEEFLQLSGIQHFAFCRRQWALAYIEMQWQGNVRKNKDLLCDLLWNLWLMSIDFVTNCCLPLREVVS